MIPALSLLMVPIARREMEDSHDEPPATVRIRHRDTLDLVAAPLDPGQSCHGCQPQWYDKGQPDQGRASDTRGVENAVVWMCCTGGAQLVRGYDLRGMAT